LTEARETGAKKRKVAWGVTGGGDRLRETVDVMKGINAEFGNAANVEVYLSKAGDQVIKYYKLTVELKQNFGRVTVEVNANSPFLAGWLQTRKYEFLLIAPATSNTVAKISVGIGDTLLSNAAIMALKGRVPVYIMPTDYREGPVHTTLPDDQGAVLKVRKEDVDNVRKLERMENVFVLEKPEDIEAVFSARFERHPPGHENA
jgi:archaeoflavoprotein AfpA